MTPLASAVRRSTSSLDHEVRYGSYKRIPTHLVHRADLIGEVMNTGGRVEVLKDKWGVPGRDMSEDEWAAASLVFRRQGRLVILVVPEVKF